MATELGTGRVLSVQSGQVNVLAADLRDPVGVAIDPDGSVLVAESGAGRVIKLTGSGVEVVVDGLQRPQSILVRDTYALHRRHRRQGTDRGRPRAPRPDTTIAAGLPVGAPPGVTPKPLRGMPPFSGPQGPFAGITAGPDGTLVPLGRFRRQRAGDPPGIQLMSEATSVDHRYLQVARTLRKEIVDGVYPVGSQLPTEHELCERFSVSRYTVREALRRLREDNLVSSRPRAGTMVVPRVSPNSYAQDNMSINDLLAFAAGAKFDIQSTNMVTIDADTCGSAPDLPRARSGWRSSVSGRQWMPSTRTAGPSTTSTGPMPRWAGSCNAIPALSSR